MPYTAQVWLCFAQMLTTEAQSTQSQSRHRHRFGTVSVVSVSQWCVFRTPPNWVRFAHSPRPMSARLPQIGFVPHVWLPGNADLPIGIVVRIGFVLPRPIGCTIHHNSFPAKHLPFFLPRRELALFGAVVPRRALPATRAPVWLPGPNWLCLAHLPCARPTAVLSPRHPACPGLALFPEAGHRGDVAHLLLVPRPAGMAGDWLRFAHLTSLNWVRLA
jgi:hypothetical protein